MKIVLLDGDRIEDRAALHAAFSDALDLPAWYGANLDALHDVLTERTDEIGVIIVNTVRLARNLGRTWYPFLCLMEDLKRERPGFYTCIEPFQHR